MNARTVPASMSCRGFSGSAGAFRGARCWTWLTFGGKPDEAIREALKSQFGARFSGKRMAWYITSHVSAAEIAAALKGDEAEFKRLQAGRYQQMAEQAMERACGIA